MPRGAQSRARLEAARRRLRDGGQVPGPLRLEVLARDGWRCRVRDAAAGTYRASALGPWAQTLVVSPECSGGDRALLQVHHVRGLATGHDPRWLLASCRACNLATGRPQRRDAAPRTVTRW